MTNSYNNMATNLDEFFGLVELRSNLGVILPISLNTVLGLLKPSLSILVATKST